MQELTINNKNNIGDCPHVAYEIFYKSSDKEQTFKIYNLLAKFINKTTQGETNNKNKNIIGNREVDNENDTYDLGVWTLSASLCGLLSLASTVSQAPEIEKDKMQDTVNKDELICTINLLSQEINRLSKMLEKKA